MENDILAQFGSRLKRIRTAKNLSQEELSRLSGIDRTYISDVERGIRNISIANVTALANALEVPVYQLFLWNDNLLERWQISFAEMEALIRDNPSLRGFLIGYFAESKLRETLAKDKRVTNLRKFDDHDRSRKHDLVVVYKGNEYSFEVKSLQTGSVKRSRREGIEWEGRFQCDASDRRKIKLGSGQEVETTCLT
ncbi:MAG: helix-turn-helix transcriptional regulator, partial [Chloroherpetonaceae bacterium]|nr:helix-turn-helix transcriptional regulator [Chloroherpetonaceae bacterium]